MTNTRNLDSFLVKEFLNWKKLSWKYKNLMILIWCRNSWWIILTIQELFIHLENSLDFKEILRKPIDFWKDLYFSLKKVFLMISRYIQKMKIQMKFAFWTSMEKWKIYFWRLSWNLLWYF